MSRIINVGEKVSIISTNQKGTVKHFFQHRLTFKWLHLVVDVNDVSLGYHTKKEYDALSQEIKDLTKKLTITK